MNYPKPERDSGLGIHGGSNAWFPISENESQWRPICDEWRSMGISWVKILSTGNNLLSAIRCIDTIIDSGLMPIVRFMWDKTYPVNITDGLLTNIRKATRTFVERGVHYFETDNEPNLIEEWQSPDAFHQPADRPGHAARAWVEKAQAVVDAGGIPLLTALAPGGHHDDEDFFPAMVRWLADNGKHDLLRHSAVSVHNYGLNHPLRFPYDDINQKEHPGATIHSGAGMSNGFLKWKYVFEVFERIMGFRIPVFTTEGGWRLTDRQDARYPQITMDVHQAYTLEQARYMAEEAPPDYVCTMDWIFASKEFGGSMDWEKAAWRSPIRTPRDAPIIAALKERGFVTRNTEEVHPPTPIPEPQPASPRIVDVVDDLPKHATKQYKTRPLSAIKRGVIHHSVAPPDLPPDRVAWWHVEKRDFPGIGYGFYITDDGTIYKTNNLTTISWHASGHNEDTIGVCFAGYLHEQPPTPEQLASGKWLIAYLDRDVGPLQWIGHNDVSDTLCPGGSWWREMLPDGEGEPGVDVAKVRELATTAQTDINTLTLELQQSARKVDRIGISLDTIVAELMEGDEP